jgi:hypothetical protein
VIAAIFDAFINNRSSNADLYFLLATSGPFEVAEAALGVSEVLLGDAFLVSHPGFKSNRMLAHDHVDLSSVSGLGQEMVGDCAAHAIMDRYRW